MYVPLMTRDLLMKLELCKKPFRAEIGGRIFPADVQGAGGRSAVKGKQSL